MTDDCPNCGSDEADCYDTDDLQRHYACAICGQKFEVTTEIVKVEKR